MADNTVYDSAFKTMVHRAPKLLIPFINRAFGRAYPPGAPIELLCDEHEEAGATRFTDSFFRLGGKLYHVECQSTADSDMVVRMVEYDFAIALEEAMRAGAPYEMNFPESCVLFLRHTENTPDVLEMRVNLPSGESFTYEVKTVKAQAFSSEEIFDDGLLLLLPYYLMRYEGALASIESDDARTAQLVAECAELRAGLESATLAAGESLLYEQLLELIIKVNDFFLASNEVLRKKVNRVMGGEVLELMGERAERLAKEAEARGIEQGIERGIEKGIEKGIKQGIERGRGEGIEALAEKLRSRGVSEDAVAAAVADLREEMAQ